MIQQISSLVFNEPRKIFNTKFLQTGRVHSIAKNLFLLWAIDRPLEELSHRCIAALYLKTNDLKQTKKALILVKWIHAAFCISAVAFCIFQTPVAFGVGILSGALYLKLLNFDEELATALTDGMSQENLAKHFFLIWTKEVLFQDTWLKSMLEPENIAVLTSGFQEIYQMQTDQSESFFFACLNELDNRDWKTKQEKCFLQTLKISVIHSLHVADTARDEEILANSTDTDSIDQLIVQLRALLEKIEKCLT